VTVLTSTRALDLEVGSSGPVAVRTDTGRIPADLVVVAVDPRTLPTLARHAGRTAPSPPPTVVHLGLAQDPPLSDRPAESTGGPRELVLHEPDGQLLVRSEATAPPGRAAWTLQVRGRLADEPLQLLARRGLDVRDLVHTRLDRSPADLLEASAGSPYGFRWQGPGTLRRRPSPVTPVPGVLVAGAATGGGGWLPFVGLTAAVVADLIGPSSSSR
jgi:UDP-galactopyranose mutase